MPVVDVIEERTQVVCVTKNTVTRQKKFTFTCTNINSQALSG